MSAHSVNEFFERAVRDPDLMEKIKAAVAERGEESSFEIVDLAAEHGFEFTATELVEHLAEGNSEVELSGAELETVTGGVTDIRSSLGRIKKTLNPGLMTNRKTEPDK